MRPIIDANNLCYSKEVLIYYTRRNIFGGIFILTGLAVGIVYSLNQDQFIISLLLSGIFLFQISYLIKSIKRIDEIQLRINSNGIQYQNENIVPWSNIENERVIPSDINDDNSNDYFIYYIIDSGQVMRFDISELSIDTNELQLTLTIHRNRYKRENNIL